MKKSTLTALIAIIGCAATLTAANLKVKQEYKKGYIKNAYTKNELPVFHFIKAEFDVTLKNGGNFDISVAEKNGSSVAAYYSEKPRLVFTVLNDTLYIKKNPANKDNIYSYSPIKITTEELKGFSANSGSYKISATHTDHFSVTVEDKAEVNLILNKVNALNLKASGNAGISLSSDNIIDYFSLHLSGNSRFNAKDIAVTQKKLQLSAGSSLQLTGRSLESFGLFNSQ